MESSNLIKKTNSLPVVILPNEKFKCNCSKCIKPQNYKNHLKSNYHKKHNNYLKSSLEIYNIPDLKRLITSYRIHLELITDYNSCNLLEILTVRYFRPKLELDDFERNLVYLNTNNWFQDKIEELSMELQEELYPIVDNFVLELTYINREEYLAKYGVLEIIREYQDNFGNIDWDNLDDESIRNMLCFHLINSYFYEIYDLDDIAKEIIYYEYGLDLNIPLKENIIEVE